MSIFGVGFDLCTYWCIVCVGGLQKFVVNHFNSSCHTDSLEHSTVKLLTSRWGDFISCLAPSVTSVLHTLICDITLWYESTSKPASDFSQSIHSSIQMPDFAVSLQWGWWEGLCPDWMLPGCQEQRRLGRKLFIHSCIPWDTGYSCSGSLHSVCMCACTSC